MSSRSRRVSHSSTPSVTAALERRLVSPDRRRLLLREATTPLRWRMDDRARLMLWRGVPGVLMRRIALSWSTLFRLLALRSTADAFWIAMWFCFGRGRMTLLVLLLL